MFAAVSPPATSMLIAVSSSPDGEATQSEFDVGVEFFQAAATMAFAVASVDVEVRSRLHFTEHPAEHLFIFARAACQPSPPP